jgi:hypothetical protein
LAEEHCALSCADWAIVAENADFDGSSACTNSDTFSGKGQTELRDD